MTADAEHEWIPIRARGGFGRVHRGWLTSSHAAKFVCGGWAVNFDRAPPGTPVTCRSCLVRVEELAARRRAGCGCDCPCHRVVRPGLVPCPRCG